MLVVVAPDSFKESLTNTDAALLMAEGIYAVWPQSEVVLCPLSDGGEGFTETVTTAWEDLGTTVEWRGIQVVGPVREIPEVSQVRARYVTAQLETRICAVLESASAVGLALIPPPLRNPLKANTFGVGQMLKAALDDGAEEIILGIGGTLTVDGGAGLLAALGAQLRDSDGCPVPAEPQYFSSIATVDYSNLDPRLKQIRLRVACDVDNPLLGVHGAAAVFGPQKGANKDQVEGLETALTYWADLVDPKCEYRNQPGAGAAGGLGMMLRILGAKLEPGAQLVADLLNLESHMATADLVLTGEGSLDFQTARGKGPGLVAQIAKRHNVPCIGFAGRLGDGHESLHQLGFTQLVGITPSHMHIEEALRQAGNNLRSSVKTVLQKNDSRN